MMKKIIACIVALAIAGIFGPKLFSQEATDKEKPTPREFAIPTSPLFDLMGVAPSQVARTAK